MPRPYGMDLRWRLIWMREFLGYSVDETDVLTISNSSMKRFLTKFRTGGNKLIIGRRKGCVAFHPREELVMMEYVVEHPDSTIGEILRCIYQATGASYADSLLLRKEWNNKEDGWMDF